MAKRLIYRKQWDGLTGYTFPDPEEVGTIYSKTLGDNLADWSRVDSGSGVTFTQDGTDCDLSGTGGTGGTGASNLFKDYIVLNETGNDFNYTCLAKWKIRVNVVTGTSGAATYGIGLGIKSVNSFEEIDTVVRFAFDTSFSGEHAHYYLDTNSTGITNQKITTTHSALSDSTEYWFEVERDELTVTSRVYASNGTTLIDEYEVTEDLINFAYVRHNTGRFAIYQFGGDTTIKSVEITSAAQKNVDFVFIGDSITYGGKAASLDKAWSRRYVEAKRGLGETYEVLAGWADRTEEAEARKAEVKALNPKRIFIHMGSNDIKDGSWTSTGNGKMDDMITYFEANTNVVDIILCTPCARNDVNVSQVKTDIDLKGYTVADMYTQTKQPANSNLLGSYNSGDGIHLNDTGNNAIGNTADALALPQI